MKASLAELNVEKEALRKLVHSVEMNKQKALAEKKDRYLCELTKLERSKNAEIKALEKKMEDAKNRGYAEGKQAYVQQCEVAKDIFFKFGQKAAAEQLSQEHDFDVFLNPPLHYIPSYIASYATAVQQKFLQIEEDSPGLSNVPSASVNLSGSQSTPPARPEVIDHTQSNTVANEGITDLTIEDVAGAELAVGEAGVNAEVELDDLFL